ncbi:large-conductance mechanosensitive channel protein MscL [bacterium]|nr:large-conductance mechanosensitive channel protein MscL [bacterium]
MISKVKGWADEFKTFAVRGNVIDMAVGIIIGASFGNIVNSLVNDIIMPPLGWIMGKVDFANMYITLPKSFSEGVQSYPSLDAAKEAGAITINYGIFINTLISFVMVAFAVFLLIKFINKLKESAKKAEAEAMPATKQCPRCFSEININATKCPHCTADI